MKGSRVQLIGTALRRLPHPSTGCRHGARRASTYSALVGGFSARLPGDCLDRHVLCSFAGVGRPRALSCFSHRLVLDRPSLSLSFQPRTLQSRPSPPGYLASTQLHSQGLRRHLRRAGPATAAPSMERTIRLPHRRVNRGLRGAAGCCKNATEVYMRFPHMGLEGLPQGRSRRAITGGQTGLLRDPAKHRFVGKHDTKRQSGGHLAMPRNGKWSPKQVPDTRW